MTNREDFRACYIKNVDVVLKKYSEKTAITYMRNSGEKAEYSFENIATYLHTIVGSINSYGIQEGDRVALISVHSPWMVYTGLSLIYAGVVCVLIDATLPEEEIKKLLDYSEVKAIFTTPDIYAWIGQDINIPCFNLKCEFDLALFDKKNIKVSDDNQMQKTDLDVAAILYSSGTTGQMKGIMITYESVLKAKDIFARLSGLKDYMTYLLVLPFNHIAGFTGAMTFFLTGCKIGYIEDVNASKLQKGLLEFQPSYFAMVPKVYEVMEQKIRSSFHEKGKVVEMLINALLKISGFLRKNFGINIGRKMFNGITKQVFGENIYGIGTGASPCKDETTEFFLNLGLEWANLYATTEAGVPIVATGIHDRYPVNTVGNVNRHPEIQIQILNPDNDGIGEIAVKSDLMMKGYFKRPDLTATVFENDYFKTGDCGYIDKKGYLHITGRIKESIILQNGKKVSPSDVDDYYLAIVSDYDIASRGIFNEQEKCDDIHMFIANKDYTGTKKEEIRLLFEGISRKAPAIYKLSEIHFVTEIPRTSVGKVKRFCLKPEEDSVDENKVNGDENESFDLIGIFSKYCNASDISYKSKIDEDLGMDSLTIFTIVCEIEKNYGVDISSRLKPEFTVGDIYNLIVNNKIGSQSIYPQRKTTKMIKALERWIALSKLIYEIEEVGAENIPLQDNYIICANHESYFDPLWILTAMNNSVDLEKICCMAAKHTMEGKMSRHFFESMGGIPVDRDGNTIPAMNSAKKCLENGHTLIVFPEGARSRDGSLLPFKNGAAKLAIDTKKEILPVKIEGAFEIFPRWIKYPRIFDWKHFKKYKLKIQFGEPIETEGLDPEELTERIKDCIINMK